jgi:hypothetical protein
VTKRGLVSPVSRIHTVRMRGEAPRGASSASSVIYMTPCGDGTTSCTGALCAKVSNACFNRGLDVQGATVEPFEPSTVMIAVCQESLVCAAVMPCREFQLWMGGTNPFRRDPIDISGAGVLREQG